LNTKGGILLNATCLGADFEIQKGE